MTTNKKISVFGGNGFIGSRFCELYEKDVVKIARNEYVPKTDEILYFISTVDNYNIHNNLHTDIETNLTVLMNVIKNLHKNNPDVVFNFVSSWFVYGQNEDIPFSEETTTCKPTGFYSITKYCAEQMLVCFCQTFNIKYRIFRLANVLGVGDNKISKKKNALQYLVKEVVNNNDIQLYYGGEVLRDYIHVDDVCMAINTCIEKASYNEIINIGRGEPTRLRSVIDQAMELTKSTSNIKHIEATRFHNIVQVRHSYLNTAKLKNYGYELKYSMDAIVKELIEYYKKEKK
jgi:nucleoside-diphosphate-sugar epimerase